MIGASYLPLNENVLIERILSKYDFIVLFFLLLIIYNFSPWVSKGNELDVLAVAKQASDPSWISGDWYLNQSTPYRFLFNYIFGTIINLFPQSIGLFTIRLLLTALYTFVLLKVQKTFGINFYLFLLGCCLYSRFPSLIAGERMMNAIETKTLAYAFCLLSLVYFYDFKVNLFWLFSGLSLTFHILVGAYNVLFLFVLFFFFYKDEMIEKFFLLLKRIWIFFLAGSVGIWAIVNQFLHNSAGDTELFSKIYCWRVWHHVNPLYYINRGISSFRLKSFLIIIISTLLLSVLLLLNGKITKKKEYRYFIIFTLISSSFLYLGALVCILQHYGIINGYSILKYYLFRFPDTIVPFFIFLFGPQIIIEWLNVTDSKLREVLNLTIVLALTLISFVFSIYPNLKEMKYYILYDYKYGTTERRELYNWISEETDKSSIFLVNPFTQDEFFFYFLAERPRFVSFKHFPQTEVYVNEWYRRLSFCFGDDLLDLDNEHNWGESFSDSFNDLSLEHLREGYEKYSISFYITEKRRDDLNKLLVYSTENYYVYKLFNL